MRWALLVCTVFFLGVLSACGSLPSSRTIVTDSTAPEASPPSTPKSRSSGAIKDYGVEPGNGARAVVEDYMERVLDEPSSARYRYINSPVKGSHGGWLDTPVAYGYVLCVWINAQSTDGGYTGEQLNFFLIRNEAVVRASPNANWLCKPYME